MINKKNILFISLFISILVTLLVAHYSYKTSFPLELKIGYEKKVDGHETKYMLHDYDGDGRSEWFRVFNRQIEKRASIMFFIDEEILIDEFSVQGRTNIEWIAFDDFNGDDKDDLILFTVDNDEVHLSIINLHTLTFIKKEEFLFSRKEKSEQFWDLNFYYLGKDSNKLFAFISAGYSLEPRLYISYDLAEDQIINKFEIASSMRFHSMVDVDNDNIKDIISVGGGTGNRPGEKFSDYSGWVFVLDQNFEFIYPPKSIGSYPNAGCTAEIISVDDRISILYANNRKTATGDKSKLFLFDAELNIRKQLEYSANTIRLEKLQIEGRQFFVVCTDNGIIELYDADLNLISERKIDSNPAIDMFVSDYDYDGSSEMFLLWGNSIKMFSENLEQLCEFELDEVPFNIRNHISINQSYKSNEAGIALNMPSGFKYYAITENLDYVLLPVYIVFIFAGLITFVYFSLSGYNNYQLFLKRRQLIRADHAFALFTIDGELIERSIKFRLSANVNSLNELLRIIGVNLRVENFVKELTADESSRVYTLNQNEIKIIFVEDERIFHEPVIYAFLTDKKTTNSGERELWSKSIQKIAHDIKTPISSLLLNLKAIGLRLDRVEFEGKEDFVADVEAMKVELSRVNNLTRGFLRFTNIEEPKLKITNLYELIGNICETFSHYTNNGIEIDVNVDNEIYINADDYQLREVFQALIENAIEAMNQNGTVSISAEEIDRMHDSALNEIMISVADHGEGMCPDTINKIFETTFSSKPTGNGLGLPIAKRIIELHCGRIEVYSRVGIGTTFKVFLPSNR